MAIEIQPASLAQVVNYRGKKVGITEDVTDVAKRLREISPDLRLFFMPESDPAYWQVERHVEQADGSVDEQLVLTSMDLGAHIVERIRQISSPDYDFVAELEHLDAKAKAKEEAHFADKRGEVLEELAHAVRTDLGLRKNF